MTIGDAVETGDGSYTLRHPDIDECYHSYDGAAKEARDLYIERSGFKERLKMSSKKIKVLDVGLGLAYNAMTTIDSWWHAVEAPDLQMSSLEINHLLLDEILKPKPSWSKAWPAVWFEFKDKIVVISDKNEQSLLRQKYPFAESFLKAVIEHPKSGSSLNWLIIVGDARKADSLSSCGETWDFIWQDPFSPEKNPAMWSSEWFSFLKKESGDQTRLMTYSVSRKTKDALNDGGWKFEKLSTSTRKKHWIRAELKLQ